jgi:hypothetical protein
VNVLKSQYGPIQKFILACFGPIITAVALPPRGPRHHQQEHPRHHAPNIANNASSATRFSEVRRDPVPGWPEDKWRAISIHLGHGSYGRHTCCCIDRIYIAVQVFFYCCLRRCSAFSILQCRYSSIVVLVYAVSSASIWIMGRIHGWDGTDRIYITVTVKVFFYCQYVLVVCRECIHLIRVHRFLGLSMHLPDALNRI